MTDTSRGGGTIMMRASKYLFAVVCVASSATARADGTTDPDNVLDPFFRFGSGAATDEGFPAPPSETIDPFTGILTLVHTDLVLPGRAGLDLAITRTYSSKIWSRADWTNESALIPQYQWNPLGYGWSLHFGRLRNAQGPNEASLCPSDYPYFEEPTGTVHQFYPTPGNWNVLLSKDQWKMVRNCTADAYYCVYSNTGTKYELGYLGVAADNAPLWQPTVIRDPHNNTIKIEYEPNYTCVPGGVCALGIVKKVTDTVGRVITFAYEASSGRVTAMWVNGQQYQYKYTTYTVNGAPVKFLTEVDPPAGASWKYAYNTTGPPQGTTANNRWALSQITYPGGATVAYQYLATKFNGGVTNVWFLPVTKKTQGGRAVPAATWTYSYNSAPGNSGGDTTTITRPDGKQDVYTLFGYAATGSGYLWKVGLPKQISYGNGARVETFSYDKDPTYISSHFLYAPDYVADGICNFSPSDSDIFVARQTSQTIQQDGKTYTTTNNAFDTYQQPTAVTETGHLTRTQALTYFYVPALNMVRGRTASEQVCVGGSCFSNSWTYSSLGDRTAETLSGVTTSYNYDSAGRLTRITDALGARVDITWTGLSPERGVPYRLTSTGGGVTAVRDRTVSWDGRITSETDPNGRVTSTSYDAIGRPTNINYPAGCDESLTYAADHSWATKTRCSHTTTTSLDGLGRATLTTDSLGVKTGVTFDAMGRTTFRSYPYDVSSVGDTMTYDALGRVTKVTHADGTYTQTSYFADYRDARTERNFIWRSYHQGFGNPDDTRLASVQDPLGNTTSYTYDGYGAMLAVNGPGTTGDRSYTYDSRHYLTSETNPETGTISYGRNLLGQTTSRQDARGTTTFTYDGLHRVVGIDHPGSADDVSFTHDPKGQIVVMQSANGGRYDHTYDAIGRMTQQKWTFGGRQYFTDYQYLNDCLDRIEHPTDYAEVRTCDAGGRLTGISGYLSAALYHPSGQLKTFKLGDGKTTTVTFDLRGRVTSSITPGVVSLSFGMDAGGNVTSYQNSTTGVTKTMTYDSIDRLLTASGPWGAGSYTYDPLGNRTKKQVGSAITNYTYHATTGRLASATGAEPGTWTWDAVGNLANGGGFAFGWDYANRMISSSDGTTYKYDGLGRRVSKTTAGGSTVVYHRDQDGSVISETRLDGVKLRDFIYAGRRLVAMHGLP